MALADLADRYNASTASIKARAAYLGIDPKNTTDDDLKVLDALDQHLEGGGSLGTFQFTETAEVEVIEQAETAIVNKPRREPEPDLTWAHRSST